MMRGADYIPNKWRERLPNISAYYAEAIPDLGTLNATGWAQAACPFHSDDNRSLSVHINGDRGHWRCSGPCGGGDLVGFHMRLHGLDFKAAVRDLIGLKVAA
jgi:DNA primase